MSGNSRVNFFLNDRASSYPYTSKNQGGGNSKIVPIEDRKIHSLRISKQLESAWNEAQLLKDKRTAVSLPTKNGVYLEFYSAPEYELATKSLENRRSGIRLMNVRLEKEGDKPVRKATVFIPKGKEHYFLKRIEEYSDDKKLTKGGNPKHENLIANIGNIRLAVLESFWSATDTMWIPQEDPKWCEVWLNSDDVEIEKEFRILSASLNIPLQDETLHFPERTVVLAFTNRSQLEELIASSPHIAEIRRAAELTSFFVDLENKEQTDWARELLDRVTVDESSLVSVCILDTGVTNDHMLLKPLLNDEDCYSYNTEWGTSDDTGHGTAMSGLVAYGDLQALLEGKQGVDLVHKLESIKILPPNGENDPQLYGAITTQSISRAIINNPERKRIICMAITAPKYTKGDGSPSSWSAAIDELTAGVLDDQRKLFVVSAGNLVDSDDWKQYPTSNKLRPVQNPAQSWNALTVGAYTEKVLLDKGKYMTHKTVAPTGGLSPYSSTSYTWDNKWPIKPEIVLEGGNLLKEEYGCFQSEELSILTTFHKPLNRQFDTIWATSAATGSASWMAGQIQAQYPNAWPETIRALLVHSAEWTETMKEQFLGGTKKGDIKELLRICGYGVPDLERALWCAKNSVNMVIQSELQPYTKIDNRYVTKDMHIHEIPWPKDILLKLGETEVSMRVTLSYFIEPGPGEVGWKDRYRYASCALRFDVNGLDSRDAFLRRVNAAVESEDDSLEGVGGANWLIGPHTRHLGSIHSDVWSGTAAELASSNLIGIYPAVGWWRERNWLGRWDKKIRYSLIVSLQTPDQNIDLYTPISTQIELMNRTEIINKI
ncbi:S8 family peptidase [Paenibacillus turicensis]|uniref:S8 family peptidase n=1 Tax=Paenibacillus turicensis TaxID=160487 RepID=UPI003D29B7E3